MENKKKIAIFDFCRTLCRLDTADRFIDYMVPATSFENLISSFLPSPWRKKLRLSRLRGLSEDFVRNAAREYVREIIAPNLNQEVLRLLLEHKAAGLEIAVVSGGYEPYLKHFCETVGVKCIATEIGFSDGICAGRIKGADCMRENKIERIKEVYDLNEYDLENSYCYSDSSSDLPILKLVGRGIAVTPDPGQLWIKNNNFETIEC